MCGSAGSRKIFNPDGGRRRGLLQPQLQTCRPSCKIAIEEYIGGTRRQILWRYRTVCAIPCVGPVDHAEAQHCIDIRVKVTRRFGTHILKSIETESNQLSLLCARSEVRRVGVEGVTTRGSRWTPMYYNKNTEQK